MNKLTVLYTLMKRMQEKEAFNGKAVLEAKLDEILVGTANVDINCAPGRCERKMELHFGQEVLKFEHQGTEKFRHPMCGSHGHHNHGGCGPRGKFERAMFLLKILDKTELQELENGTKILSLNLLPDELPNCLSEQMKNKRCGIENTECLCGHHEKLKGWMASCGCMALDFATLKPENLRMTLTLNSDCSPADMNTVISGSAFDQEGKTRIITITAGCKHQ